jgi:2-oxoglutarate dehydrogenase E1 component
MERFLLLAAEDNFQVAVPTTPAQIFHLLRRQMLRKWRKPLVCFTPKSLLRHPEAVSTWKELAEGRFHEIIGDDVPESEVSRVLLCSGKIYYELIAQRKKLERKDLAVVRVEQLYPFSEDDLHNVLDGYPDGTQVSWVQEEPENMGAWRYLHDRFGRTLLGRWPLDVVSRPCSASPATGSKASHELEQEKLLDKVFS